MDANAQTKEELKAQKAAQKALEKEFAGYMKIAKKAITIDGSVPEISRKYDLAKACKNINYGFPVRMIEYFDFLGHPFLFIII